MHRNGPFMKSLKRIAKVLVLMCLVLSVALASQFETFHSFFHGGTHGETHSEKQEADPCHRLIYHNDVEQGCDHGSHLLFADKCDMCDLEYRAVCVWEHELIGENPEFEETPFSLLYENFNSREPVFSSPRAPPFTV